MNLIPGKSFQDIDEADLNSLVDNQVSESKFIEYKLLLPGNADSDKKEFLADASSFANAAGGHLIYGVREEDGLPQSPINGLADINPDEEILRLENMLRDGIAPRLPGLNTRAIPLQNNNCAIIIHIPKSWVSPHMIIYSGNSKFYSRNSAGKYQLDVHELRNALGRYLTIYGMLEIEPPLFVILSLLGVYGCVLPAPRRFLDWRRVIDKNDLIVPEILIEDTSWEHHNILRPAFDTVWNAAGYEGSPHYDEEGNWNRR
jgi:hypothetical protein